MKAFKHLVAAAKALNVVITGKGGMAYVTETNGTHLFAMRGMVIDSCPVERFENFVKNCREQLAKQASN